MRRPLFVSSLFRIDAVPLVPAPVANGEPVSAVSAPVVELILYAATPEATLPPFPVTAAYRYVPLASMETRPVPVASTVTGVPEAASAPVDSLKVNTAIFPAVASETNTNRPSGSNVTADGADRPVATGEPTAVRAPSCGAGGTATTKPF